MTLDLKGSSFLILDQDEQVRTVLKSLLKANGAGHIYLEEDGTEGLRILKTTEVDIVICGANMQPLGGRDFTRIVRRDETLKNREVPIILATKEISHSLVKDARDSGINDIVAKPLNALNVLKKLLKGLNNHRAFIDTRFYVGPDRRSIDQGFRGEERRH